MDYCTPNEKKFDLFAHFHSFLAYSERRTSKKLKFLQSGGSDEYVNRAFGACLDNKIIVADVILHIHRIYATSKRHCRADERTLLDWFRCMIRHKNVSKCFRADAIVNMSYLGNQTTCSGLPNNMTPRKSCNRDIPNVSHIQGFGSKCCYHVGGNKLGMLDDRAK